MVSMILTAIMVVVATVGDTMFYKQKKEEEYAAGLIKYEETSTNFADTIFVGGLATE